MFYGRYGLQDILQINQYKKSKGLSMKSARVLNEFFMAESNDLLGQRFLRPTKDFLGAKTVKSKKEHSLLPVEIRDAPI